MQDHTDRSNEHRVLHAPGGPRVRRAPNRINWVRHLHTWHWMSSAICLVGLILFAATGITLNNAQTFEREEPHIQRRTDKVPTAVLERMAQAAKLDPPQLPREADAWLRSAYGITAASRRLDWSDGELNLSVPRPGGSTSLRVDLKSGELAFERTDRGVIAYLNDLHKGRHAGPGWGWFLDIFAGAALLSAFTGLLILIRQSSMRRSIWPLVGFGAVVPAIVIFLFVH